MPEIEWSRLSAAALNDLAGKGAIVLLPVASTEQHGPHLATGVDALLCAAVCRRTATMLEGEIPVVVAPTLWCGLAEHHLAFGGTFSLSFDTWHRVLRDLCASIIGAGFSKIALINGHGGNMAGLEVLTTELTRELKAPIAGATYFMDGLTEAAAVLEDQPGVMHACEAETSMMMVVAPELVDTARLPEAKGPDFNLAAGSRASLRRWQSFSELTDTGVAGDARRATPEKGEALLAAYAGALARRLKAGEPWS